MNGDGELLRAIGVVTSEKCPWLKPTERYALGIGVGSSIRSSRTDLHVARHALVVGAIVGDFPESPSQSYFLLIYVDVQRPSRRAITVHADPTLPSDR